MEIAKNTVVFFKSPKEGTSKDPYLEEVESIGLHGVCYPALSFNYINLKEMYQALKKPEDFSAIIITSQNGVKGFERTIEEHGSSKEWKDILAPQWRKKDTFVVGPATAHIVADLGLNPVGAESGNGETLFPLIEKSLSQGSKPVLYPCGNLAREVIPNKMKEAGLELRGINVYETCADQNIKDNLTSFIQMHQGFPEYLVFYSPSGINFNHDIFRELDFPLKDIKFIAIGPTTEAALKKKGFTEISTAAKPTPHQVLEAIKAFK